MSNTTKYSPGVTTIQMNTRQVATEDKHSHTPMESLKVKAQTLAQLPAATWRERGTLGSTETNSTKKAGGLPKIPSRLHPLMPCGYSKGSNQTDDPECPTTPEARGPGSWRANLKGPSASEA